MSTTTQPNTETTEEEIKSTTLVPDDWYLGSTNDFHDLFSTEPPTPLEENPCSVIIPAVVGCAVGVALSTLVALVAYFIHRKFLYGECHDIYNSVINLINRMEYYQKISLGVNIVCLEKSDETAFLV